MLKDRALVVGIDRYPDIGTLQGAERDALAFLDWVTSAGGVEPGMAMRIVSSDFPPAGNSWDEQPAREKIERFFREVDLAAQQNNQQQLGLRAGRRLYLFFSGHGFAPALDKSGVLMANASPTAPMNVAAMWWADRMYEGGWFDEVLLFQDACRASLRAAELSPPFLSARTLPNMASRRRFYAFSAKNQQKSVEKPDATGNVRGVFSLTLLAGLSEARDPVTGGITAAQLKAYLQSNMKAHLTQSELDDPDIAKQPEVYDPDPFVIVEAPAGWAAKPEVSEFPVQVALRGASRAQVLGEGFAVVKVQDDPPDPWSLALPRGYYLIQAPPFSSPPFEVSGAVGVDGQVEVTNVVVA